MLDGNGLDYYQDQITVPSPDPFGLDNDGDGLAVPIDEH